MEETKLSILLVDDDKDLRDIMATKLKAAGYVVFEAENGEDGLAKAMELMPDLLILDINMPKLNGMEMFSKLKADTNLGRLKVVFLTSYGEPQAEAAWLDKKFAKEIGAIGYIRKTDDLDKIVKFVSSLMPSSKED
ncbi:MAG: response regulator [bacterium]|nr:response regulator [bacterium]